MSLVAHIIEFRVTNTLQNGTSVVTQLEPSVAPITSSNLAGAPYVLVSPDGSQQTYQTFTYKIKIYDNGALIEETPDPQPLSAVKVPADQQPFDAANKGYVNAGDANTLQAAKDYADSVSSGCKYLKSSIAGGIDEFESDEFVPIPGLNVSVNADGDWYFSTRLNVKPDKDDAVEVCYSINGSSASDIVSGSITTANSKKNKDGCIIFFYTIPGLQDGDIVSTCMNSDDEEIDIEASFTEAYLWPRSV